MTPEVQAAADRLESGATYDNRIFDTITVIQALRDAERLLTEARKQGQVEALEWAGHKMASRIKSGALVIRELVIVNQTNQKEK